MGNVDVGEEYWSFILSSIKPYFEWFRVIFLQSTYTTVDYVTWIASVAVGTNGVSTVSKTINNIIKWSDKRAYEIFVRYTLDYISDLSKQTEICQMQIEKDGEQQAKNLKKKQIKAFVKHRDTVEKNQKILKKATEVLTKEALRAKVTNYKNIESFDVISFVFAVVSIFALVFSPQIANEKIHSFWFLILFLPQIILLGYLINAWCKSYFPLKYITLVVRTRGKLWQKIWAPVVYEWKIITYKTGEKEKITNGAEVGPIDTVSLTTEQ